jgi:hypothetical protein
MALYVHWWGSSYHLGQICMSCRHGIEICKGADMNVPILVAIIAFVGTIVGGTIVTAGNYFLARMREQTEAARAAEIQAGELKMAARLIASELQQDYLTVEYYVKERRWWRPDEELSTEAWKGYKHLLAPHLPYDAWDNVAHAVINANQANALFSLSRPDNIFLEGTVTTLTLLAQNMRKGHVGLMPYVL